MPTARCAKVSTEPWTAPRLEASDTPRDAAALVADAASTYPSDIRLDYLRPLVRRMIGDGVAESVVARVSKGGLTVAALAELVEGCVEDAAFPLGIQGPDTCHYARANYSSAEEGRAKVSEALRKRLEKGHTLGPYQVHDASTLFAASAVNPLGAVPKRDCDALRPVEDVWANLFIDPPTFAMPTMEYMRETATPGGYWWVVDVEDAFAQLSIPESDRPWTLFRWYHPDDAAFEGEPTWLYMHVRGFFGPRTYPYWYTLLQLYVNIGALAADVPAPLLGYIDDNAQHSPTYGESKASLDAYLAHLSAAGLPVKLSKLKLPFQVGEIIGRLFNSIDMTVSIPLDKVWRLSEMLGYVTEPARKLRVSEALSLWGLWEHCLECLPLALKAFGFNLRRWVSKLKYATRMQRERAFWVPRKVKEDAEMLLTVLPMCNGTQPIQPLRGRMWRRPIFTDASDFGGGYVSPEYVYARKFTCRERKACIAVKETKMVDEAVHNHVEEWAGCVQPVHVDNTASFHAFRKGRSRNKRMNEMIRRSLLACAAVDAVPIFYFVPSEANIADAASRLDMERLADELTCFVWPDNGMALETPPESIGAVVLPARVRDEVERYRGKAYAPGSLQTWSSGWAAWTQYCKECSCDPLAEYSEEEFEKLMAGFAAMLAAGAYGRGKHKAANTIGSYEEAVKHFRNRHFGRHLHADVMRGVQKVHGKTERIKRAVTLDMACKLVECADVRKLADVRNIVAYAHLGQGITRAQSAVCAVAERWEASENLSVADVRVDEDRYAVGFGHRRQKSDVYRENMDESGRDWVWVAGARGCVLDVVQVTKEYISRMGFSSLTAKQQRTTPFYQDIVFNRGTGAALTYAQLLAAFRADLGRLRDRFYPGLRPEEYGLHAWRRFGAVTAKMSGVPDSIIKKMGRWRSQAFEAYFVFTEDDKIFWSQALLQQGGGVPHAAPQGVTLQSAPSAGAAAEQVSSVLPDCATTDHSTLTSSNCIGTFPPGTFPGHGPGQSLGSFESLTDHGARGAVLPPRSGHADGQPAGGPRVSAGAGDPRDDAPAAGAAVRRRSRRSGHAVPSGASADLGAPGRAGSHPAGPAPGAGAARPRGLGGAAGVAAARDVDDGADGGPASAAGAGGALRAGAARAAALRRGGRGDRPQGPLRDRPMGGAAGRARGAPRSRAVQGDPLVGGLLAPALATARGAQGAAVLPLGSGAAVRRHGQSSRLAGAAMSPALRRL